MPNVTMPTDHPAAELIVNGQRIRHGEPAQVSDEDAESYDEQGWTVTADPAPEKADAAKKDTGKKKTDASQDANPEES